MISVTFPDGAQRQFEPGVSGVEIARSISPSLAKRTVAMTVDGVLADLADRLHRDSKIEFVGREDPRALELIRIARSFQYYRAGFLCRTLQTLWRTRRKNATVINDGDSLTNQRDFRKNMR